MTRLLAYRNLHLIPAAVILALYLIPTGIGLLATDNRYNGELLVITCVAVSCYFTTAFALRVFFPQSDHARILCNWRVLCTAICALYFFVIAYACITTPRIALMAALQGAPIDEISSLREQFLRTRIGFERIFLYLYAFSISSLMPLALGILFLKKARVRFIVMGAFLFSLLLTLEKSLSITAIIPLICIFYNSDRRRHVTRILVFLIIAIIIASFLARGGLQQSGETSPTESALATVPPEYNLFPNSEGQIYYVLNRIIYIPYISAIDWLRFLDQKLQNNPIQGLSIGPLAQLTGKPTFNLEREIFSFQWGQNETGTGSANTIYFVDAYLNFGLTGVILYSMLLALLVHLCMLAKNRAVCAGLCVPLIYVSFNSLPAIIFSGGLFALVATALFLRFDDPQIEWQHDDQSVFS